MKSITNLVFFVVWILSGPWSYGQDTTSVTLTFFGDVMGHDSQIRSAYNKSTDTFDYNSCFRYIRDELSWADITIGNLEVTLGSKPYKGYPSFSSPVALASALQQNGVDYLVTANNHTCDRGKKGILKTIDLLDSLQLPHTGSFRDKQEMVVEYPMILEKNGLRLALLNYTYGTNGIKVPAPTVVNLIDRDKIKEDLMKAQKSYVDAILVFMHWGQEYQSYPNKAQKELYTFLKENGADFVIGSHPHVVQPIIHENDHMVAYSLGNYISNQRKPRTDGGIMLNMELKKVGDKLWIENLGYMLTWVYTPYEKGRKEFYVLPASKFESDVDFFPNLEDLTKMKTFIKDSRALFDEANKNVGEYVYDRATEKWIVDK